MDFLTSYVSKRLLDVAWTGVKNRLARVEFNLSSPTEALANALERHLTEVRNWASETTFADLRAAKRTGKIFVPLDCYVIPRQHHVSKAEKHQIIALETLIATSEIRHLLFLGTPGAGKTTSMRHLCLRILTDDTFAVETIHFPIVIRLRELNNSKARKGSLTHWLWDLLALKSEFRPSKGETPLPDDESRLNAMRDAIYILLNNTKALLIIDGFDELSNADLRCDILNEIRLFTLHLETARLILTSRTGELDATIDNAKTYELCPLNAGQISMFASRFFDDENSAKSFLEQIERSPFSDTAIKPLTLAHLCAVFERLGYIPEKPKTVYRKILRLLLEDWDDQRSVNRASRYSSFQSDRKYDFLCSIAYKLTLLTGSTVFSTDTLCSMYEHCSHEFGLPKHEAPKVAKELEGHTGLFVRCGFDSFEFAHKSLQEFLSAEFLVKLPSLPEIAVLEKLPHELAIAVSISSSPGLYLAELSAYRLLKTNSEFISTFWTRLMQERPDFNHDRTSVFGLLGLASALLNRHGSLFNASDSNNAHAALKQIQEIEDLASRILKAEASLREVILFEMAHRYVPGRSIGKDFRGIRILEKGNGYPGLDIPLPEKLLIRQAFYDIL